MQHDTIENGCVCVRIAPQSNHTPLQVEPSGMLVRVNVVVKFHPIFLTKIDRAYAIECFYMEADKTVDQLLNVR